MSVITISRGFLSGGEALAECLAERLGYRCVDRDVIVEKAAAQGVAQQEIVDAMQKPPTFLERFTHKKYLYLTLVQAALTEEVRTGRVVYHGNAGHLLLEGGAPVLRVRIVAPMDFRIQMARKRLKLTEREAIEYLNKRDLERQKWTQYLYGTDWFDPGLYDVVINLEHITIPESCATIASLVKRQPCYEFGPDCQAIMDNLTIASRVKSKLARESVTAHLEFVVRSDKGVVSIGGRLSSIDLLPEVERIARSVEGVESVNVEQLASPTQA
jgi:cytidylate kinase